MVFLIRVHIFHFRFRIAQQRDRADECFACVENIHHGIAVIVKSKAIMALHPAGDPVIVPGGKIDAVPGGGIGDALATYYEARATKAKDAGTCAGGKITMAAMALAELCLDTLLEEGVKAKLALESGACTESVEKVIEANTLLSGIGFESGGLAAAHAIHNGLTVLPECHHMYHGEKVAFGVLTQLMLENVPTEELDEILASPRARAIYEGFSCRRAVEPLCRKCGYAHRFD